MEYKIIADSCCDSSVMIREDINLELVPLKILFSHNKEYTDTLDLDIDGMLDDMKYSASVNTACPSVEDYAQYMYKYDNLFVVTLGSFLSGSYNAAAAARDIVLREHPDKQIYVFDSLNASAGELNIVLFINRLVSKGYSFEQIVKRTETYISTLATFFVLEDLTNMIKNGRMSRIAEKVATLFGIHPVLYKFDVKEIRLAAKVRGLQHAFERIVEYIEKWTNELLEKSVDVILSHCEAEARAELIKERILFTCKAIHDVIVVPTSGLSAVYANRGGIIISFQTVNY